MSILCAPLLFVCAAATLCGLLLPMRFFFLSCQKWSATLIGHLFFALIFCSFSALPHRCERVRSGRSVFFRCASLFLAFISLRALW